MVHLPGRIRASWPLLLLVGGLACIALALVEAQRSIRSNRSVADNAVAAYSSVAAWSFQEHFSEAVRLAAQEVLGGVNMFHQTPPIPSAGGPGHALHWNEACQCHQPLYGPMPVAFVAFALGTDTLGVAHNQAPAGTPGWLVDEPAHLEQARPSDPPLSPPDAHWINARLTALARSPVSPWGYRVLIADHGDSTLAFAMTNMPTSWGDTIVYAVQYAGRSIDSLLAATFEDQDLLPGAVAVKGSNRAILAADVRDQDGRVLFASDVPREWTREATVTLPPSYGALSIRMEIQPALVERVVIGGLPRSRLPLLLALLALATGLTGIAVVQLRREARFAHDRSAFVASASHELRTPLAQIRLVVDMLRLDREKDPVRREASLALVDREVTRLQHLVDTVLRFSRGNRSPALLAEPTDVVAEARSVVAEFLPLAQPRGVGIAVHATGAPIVALQAGAVRQILLNLLDNAVKYGPDRQSIAVDVEALGEHGARLIVTDSGPGVPVAERERIWQPFERGSAAALRAAGGSGIGLTVVREIAERHGGSTRVEADSNAGARFVVDFPGTA